jgi:hypothetical protein
MAEFCTQCAENMGFEPDFIGLTTAEEWAKDEATLVLCEGCGFTLVDPDGRCITNCAIRHVPDNSGYDAQNASLGVFGNRYAQ